MNTLDVCCALIELPAARGPLLLGAKKKTGQSNGLLYEFPGGKVEPGENARHDCKPHETCANKWKRCSNCNHDCEDILQIPLTTPDSLHQR